MAPRGGAATRPRRRHRHVQQRPLALRYLLLPVALGHSYLAMAVANSVYLVAAAAYFYVTHLGFRALPFLHSTECFLYPVVALMGCLLVSLVLGAFGLKVNVLRILVMGLLGARPSVLE